MEPGKTGSTTAEPSINDLSPMMPAGVENEPMLLLDTTGSMSYQASPDSPITRQSVIEESIGTLIGILAAKDSQAAKEAAAGLDAGGLMTYTFAGGQAQTLDDLSPTNWREKWKTIQWGGSTEIMPGWTALVEGYMEEFGERPATDRPHLLALVITDGEAEDTQEFADTLGNAGSNTYVCLALLGYGEEHDRAQAAYQKIAEQNKRVRVVTFQGETDPKVIADGLVSLLGG